MGGGETVARQRRSLSCTPCGRRRRDGWGPRRLAVGWAAEELQWWGRGGGGARRDGGVVGLVDCLEAPMADLFWPV